MANQYWKDMMRLVLIGVLTWPASVATSLSALSLASAEETKNQPAESGITERGPSDKLSELRFPKRAPTGPRPPLAPPPSPLLPDLVPTGAAASGCLVYTADKRVIVTVKNVGTSPAGPSKTRVDAVGASSVFQTNGLAPGERHVHIVATQCPNHYCPVRVTVDAEHVVAESVESNNVTMFACAP
jgi:hypothetical protein